MLAKLREEIDEVEAAIVEQHARAAVEDELGDILFCVVNLARHLDLDAEQALKCSNNKFIRRFNHIEDSLKTAGRGFADSNLTEMEALWVAAKRLEGLDEKI